MYQSTLIAMPVPCDDTGTLTAAVGKDSTLSDISTLLASPKPAGIFAAVGSCQAAEMLTSSQEHLAPPKKPLSPYMTFSKEIWPRVKTLNKNATVCEIGAVIGRLWREMDDATKQRYNDVFTVEKQRYDSELQAYLRATGLQASDLNKPRPKKKEIGRPAVPTLIPQLMPESSGSLVASINGLPPLSLVWSQQPDAEVNAAKALSNGADKPGIPLGVPMSNSNGFSTFVVPTIGIQPGEANSFATLDTSSLSAETISQLRPADSSGIIRPQSLTACQPPVQTAPDIESELVHLRNALSEQTIEAQRLTQELDRANRIVEELRELCHEHAAAAAVNIDATNAVFA